jgi:putative MATE family efflux protein
VAGSVLVAQNVGAGDRRQAEYAAAQTVMFSFVLAAGVGAVGYFIVDDLLRLFGAAPDTLVAATAYMQIIALGMPLMFGFFIFISLMRGYGDTVTPMLVMFGTVVLNIVLDPFLIFGWTVVENAPLVGTVAFPEMGIQGAAIATVFSRALALVVGLAIMFRGKRGVQIHLLDMVPDLSYLRRLFRIGLPASIEGTGRALSMNLLLVIVARFPDTVVAAYGSGTRVFSVVFLPAIAVARGVETMTGQNMGANKPDRAEQAARLAAKFLFGVLSVAGVVVFLFPEPIVSVFVGADQADAAQVVEIGGEFLRYVALTFGFIGIMRAYTGSFRGAGKTLTAAAISVLTLGIIRFPIAWISAGPLGEVGIWLSFAISNVAGAVIAYAWYRRGTWRASDLTESRVDLEETSVEAAGDG